MGPLGAVIQVAEQVRGGNLSPRVPDNLSVEEIAQLAGPSTGCWINYPKPATAGAGQFAVDQRREFTEAVLGGVSSGVIGLDADGKGDVAKCIGAARCLAKQTKN